MHDLIIRGGTIADGSGQPTRHRRRRRRRQHRHRRGRGRRTRRGAIDRRRRPARHAGLGRHPHPLRRPGHLGPRGLAVGLARGDHRRHGQLRRRLRAGPRVRPRLADPAHGGRGGHPGHRAGRGHELELGDLRRVPRRGGAHGPRARRGLARPPRRAARLRARRGPGQRHGQRGGDRRDGGARARGRAGRRHRRVDDPHDPAPGQGRRAGGRDHGGGRRARSPSARRWARRATGSSRWPATCGTSTTSSPGCRRSPCGPACP